MMVTCHYALVQILCNTGHGSWEGHENPPALSLQPVSVTSLISFDVSKHSSPWRPLLPLAPSIPLACTPLLGFLVGLLFPCLPLSFTCSPDTSFSALLSVSSLLTDLTIPKASISILVIMNLKDIFSEYTTTLSLMYHIILISSSFMTLWVSCRIPNLVCPNWTYPFHPGRETPLFPEWDIASKPAACVYPLLHFLTINIQSDLWILPRRYDIFASYSFLYTQDVETIILQSGAWK